MKKTTTKTCLTLIIAAVISCQNKDEKSQKSRLLEQTGEPGLSKMEYYQDVMDEKSFSLTDTAPCDDAFDDTAHDWGEIYIDSALLTDSTATVEFKFKDACCQVFMGDYEVQDGILRFGLEPVNDVTCSCVCWYRYKLEVNALKTRVKQVEVSWRRTRG